jgi:hypothetical protein
MEEIMNITSAKYEKEVISGEVDTIIAVIDGITLSVPLDKNNRHYREIKKQEEAGTLTIEAAD